MTRPTLIQSLLNRPSQSYSFPAHKDYHSRSVSLRAHTAAPAPPDFQLQHPSTHDPDYCSADRDDDPEQAQLDEPEEYVVDRDDQGSLNSAEHSEEEEEEDDDDETFYSAASSPRDSLLSTTSTTSLSSDITPMSLVSSVTTPLATTDDGGGAHSFYTPLPTPAPRKRTRRSVSSRSSVTSSSAASSAGHDRYSDEDWAREVRWLVAPNAAKPHHAVKRSYTLSDAALSSHPRRTPSDSSHHRKSRPPSIMMILEEEDDEGSSQLYTQPKSGVLINGPSTTARLEVLQDTGRYPLTRPKSPTLSSEYSLRRPALPRRRSRSLENKPTHQRHATSPSITSASSALSAYASTTSSHLPSQGTPGYTSLTLPRAPPPSRLLPNNRRSILLGSNYDIFGGKVDLTVSGLAQTTMASVEVVQGLSNKKSTDARTWFGTKRKRKAGKTPGGLNASSCLGFTHHRKPPESVSGSDVLVQVWAVGVDDTDRRLLFPPSSSPASMPEPNVGWIPGRSIVGRVVEVGWDVKDDCCKRGEWIIGLLDVRKSGGLAEFVLIERHRLMRIPHPTSSPYSIEELALLPLCGVPAFRVARSFLSAFSRSEADTPISPRILILQGDDGIGYMVGQILVKNGWSVVIHCRHYSTEESSDGSAETSPESSQERLHAMNSDSGHSKASSIESATDPRVIEARVLDWGAERVIFGDEVKSLNHLANIKDSEGSFDAILDTVGGKDIWEAGERLLLSNHPRSSKRHRSSTSLFATTVGDTPSRVIPTNKDNFLSSLRSWGRGGGGKVGYAWVSVAQDVDWEGMDVRDTLAMIIGGPGAAAAAAAASIPAMEAGGLRGARPYVGGSVTLDKAMGMFDAWGTSVVKVV